MEIKVRRDGRFAFVKVHDGGATIDLGMLDEQERDDLAKALLDAVWTLGPDYSAECGQWLARLIDGAGIDLNNIQLEEQGIEQEEA